MCGIVGVVANEPVNQLLYDALLLLQHRGQDAAGIATHNGNAFHMHKANGFLLVMEFIKGGDIHDLKLGKKVSFKRP